ncbi:MAG: AMP-binding protein [Pseudomonadota bacterium]
MRAAQDDFRKFLDEGEMVLDRLDACAVSHADKVFIFDGENHAHITFSEFKVRTDRIAAALAGIGLPRGAPVCVLTQNSVLNALWMFAVWRAGGLFAPVNFNLRGELLSYQVKDTNPFAVLTDADSLSILETLTEDVKIGNLILPEQEERSAGFLKSPAVGAVHFLDQLMEQGGEVPAFQRTSDELANIIYTSGTTGAAKGVVHNFRWIAQYSYTLRAGMTEDDVIYCDLPLYHVAGAFNTVARAVWHANTVGLWNRFSASQFWARIAECGATSCTMIGVMIPWLMGAPASGNDRNNTLNKVTLAPLPENHNEIARRFGIDFVRATFGQTESGSSFHAIISEFGEDEYGTPRHLWKGLPKDQYLAQARALDYCVVDGRGKLPQGFIGKPNPMLEVAILDDRDYPCLPGTVGQIAIRPRFPGLLMREYLNKPAATLTAFSNCWFHTGDLGRAEGNGTFAWVSRMGDFCRVRGENVSLFDVENLVARHAKVRQSAAIGVRADAGGEDEIAVFVELESGQVLSVDELRVHNAAVMPRYMQPAHVFFIDVLPQTPTGKVQKHPLKPLLVKQGLQPSSAK